jgi:hypothetical protein
MIPPRPAPSAGAGCALAALPALALALALAPGAAGAQRVRRPGSRSTVGAVSVTHAAAAGARGKRRPDPRACTWPRGSPRSTVVGGTWSQPAAVVEHARAR